MTFPLPAPPHLPETPTPGWKHHAACKDMDPELFFPPTSPGKPIHWDTVDNTVKAACIGCKVRADCLVYAIRTRSEDGIFAGTDPSTRRRVRRGRPALRRHIQACGWCAAEFLTERGLYCSEACSEAARRARKKQTRTVAKPKPRQRPAPTPPPRKRCAGCNRTLPEDQWHRNRSAYDGLATHCKTCTNRMKRERHRRQRQDRKDVA